MLNQFKFADREGLLFVGGFRHTPNQDGILWLVNEIYPIIRKQLLVPLRYGAGVKGKVVEAVWDRIKEG